MGGEHMLYQTEDLNSFCHPNSEDDQLPETVHWPPLHAVTFIHPYTDFIRIKLNKSKKEQILQLSPEIIYHIFLHLKKATA